MAAVTWGHVGGIWDQLGPILLGPYEASKDGGDDQAVRTAKLHKQMVERLRAEKGWATHLAATSRRHASAWLLCPGVLCDKSASGFSAALQLRPRWAPANDTQVQCQCGFISAPGEHEIHALGCARSDSNGPKYRHDAVARCISQICKKHGIPNTLEPHVSGAKRADIEIFFLSRTAPLDLTIPNSTCASHAKKSASALEKEKDAKKQAHYADSAASVETLQIEVFGGFGNVALKLAKTIADEADVDTSEIVEEIAKSLACGNGRIIESKRRTARAARTAPSTQPHQPPTQHQPAATTSQAKPRI